jgi:hypothetical protein
MRWLLLLTALSGLACGESRELPAIAPRRLSDALACDPDISVRSDGPALIVQDPAILERFTLERVLEHLIDRAGADEIANAEE